MIYQYLVEKKRIKNDAFSRATFLYLRNKPDIRELEEDEMERVVKYWLRNADESEVCLNVKYRLQDKEKIYVNPMKVLDDGRSMAQKTIFEDELEIPQRLVEIQENRIDEAIKMNRGVRLE